MASAKVEVAVADYPDPDKCARRIVELLQMKGFCIIDPGCDEDQCAEAIEEARALQAAWRFKPPPEQVLQGVLGSVGSAQICHMKEPEDNPSGCKTLQKFDHLATSIGRMLENEIQMLGFEISRRSAAILHETGKWDSKLAPPMTEVDADFWLNCLVWHRLMAIQFFGPGDVTLEMAYLESSEESESFKLELGMGSMVLLRPDILEHMVSGTPGNVAMSCWFLPPSRKAAFRGGTLPDLTPAAALVDSWAMDRLEQMANEPVSYDPNEVIVVYRVIAPAVFVLDVPKDITLGGERLEIAKKGEVLYGTVELVDGWRWLKVPTKQFNEYGQQLAGWVLIDSEQTGVGILVQEINDIPTDWLVATHHLYTHPDPVCVRSCSSKFATSHDESIFFLPSIGGADFGIDVPFRRFSNFHYVWAPPEYNDFNKTTTRHCAFTDGIDLFDNKKFSISNAEVTSMDPMQRMALESADEAFTLAGCRKEHLMRSVSGVYLAGGSNEWGYVEREYDASGDMYGCTGGSGAIQANRISFNLGLMGPSIVFSSEGVASLMALERGYVSFANEKQACFGNVRCVCTGTSLALSPYSWIRLSWEKVMWNGSFHGRCKSWDDTASGYIRGDGVASVVLTRLIDTVDGERVRDDSLPEEGLLTGGFLMYYSTGHLFASPHGPAEQSIVTETCRKSMINPIAVDIMECNAEGRVLADAVEAVSIAKSLRGDRGASVPIFMTSFKSTQGFAQEAAGMGAFLKTLKGAQWGAAGPTQHLYRLNPHIDHELHPMQFMTEVCAFRQREVVSGVKQNNLVGILAMVTIACSVDDEKIMPSVRLENAPERIAFWPGGGGSLEDRARPRRGYDLIGSWDGWQEPIPMVQAYQEGEERIYAATVTLGVNRFEQFRILVDGDHKKMLHPGQDKAHHSVPVFGPDAAAHGFSWLIDGRTLYWQDSAAAAVGTDSDMPALTDPTRNEGGSEAELPTERGDDALVPYEHEDHGLPGTQYRVQLHIAGRWRVVTWSKVTEDTPALTSEQGAITAEPGTSEDHGRYYVVANWNDFSLSEEMMKDESTKGLFYTEVKLKLRGGEFQIVRNRDWGQAFFPEVGGLSIGGAALGPGDYLHGQSWVCEGEVGDVVRIEFQRSYELDQDVAQVSWKKQSNGGPLSWEEKRELSWPRYYIVGTMNTGLEGKIKMDWDSDGQFYGVEVQIGKSGEESFQILQNGDWDQVIFPSLPDATQYTTKMAQGPSHLHNGRMWVIGRHEDDAEAANTKYMVKLTLGRQARVTWTRM